jgi:septal ring factor EnvC (AmiA/AmiB activator)
MSIEVLAKRIEEAYEALDKTIEKVGMLTGIVDQFKISTESIIEKYIITLEPSRMAEMRESSKKHLQKMIEDIDSIDKALKNYEVVEFQLVEQITNFQQRINNLENNLQNTRKSLQDMDTKLLRLIKEAEKNQQSAQKRFTQASQLISAEKEI